MRARLTQALTAIGLLLATAGAASGQPAPAPPATDPPQWQWSGEASAFAGFNYQRRKFFDFDAWESQNWLMGAIERRSPVWQIRALTMLTFEPFSLGAVGSPQALQTG